MKSLKLLITLILSFAATVSPSQVDPQPSELPKVRLVSAPKIPTLAKFLGVGNKVEAELKLDAKGAVTSVQILEGDPLFGGVTEYALEAWRFEPSEDKAAIRSVRLTVLFSPFARAGKQSSVIIKPYNLDLDNLPPEIKREDRVSLIPSTWREGRDSCKVHDEILKKDKVEIVYGLVGFKRGYLEAEERQFPNSNTVIYGGCLVDYAKYAEVLYCRKCRMAKAKWIQAHRKNKFVV